MCISKGRRSASAPLLLLFAGVAFLAVTLLSRGLSPIVTGMQLFTAALFFLAAYLHYRRLR